MSRHARRAAAALLGLAQAACTQAVVGRRPALETDRPDFTEATSVVAPGGLQVEAGDTFARGDGEESNALGEVLLRVGVLPGAELRVGLNSLVHTRAQGVPGAPWSAGREDASLGTKLRLVGEEGGRVHAGGLVPATSLIVGTTLPTGTRGMRRGAEPEAKLLLGWDLSDRWALSSNVNAASLAPGDGRGRTPEASASLSLGHTLTERVGSYAEAFAFRPRGLPGTQFVNGGVTVLVSDDLQLDARAGKGLGANARDLFFGVGFARRW